MSSLRSNTSGFTLIEIMVSIVIIVIFVTAVTNLTITNDHIGHEARNIASLNSYAENKIEALRSAGYLSLTNGTTSVSSELPAELKTPRTGTLVISSATSSVKKIDLTITYNDLGHQKTFSYTTYIGELGVGQN